MSHTDERETPDELFKPLNDEFHFELDVCATAENAKCANYFDKGSNGLKQNWAPKRCFMNSPYSNISKWLEKAKNESEKGALIVAILPNDSSTRWFHKYIWNKTIHSFRLNIKVRYPDKRHKFGKHTTGAKFATMIVIFEPRSN